MNRECYLFLTIPYNSSCFRYGFGWEPQLAELTFHAMFMAPFLSLNPIPYKTPVPIVTIWVSKIDRILILKDVHITIYIVVI